MKFLVLALCVYAASAVPAFRGNQPWQYASQAAAKVAVPVAQTVATAVVQPFVAAKTIAENGEASANILRSESDVNSVGFDFKDHQADVSKIYIHSYETQNGIVASSNGRLKTVDNADVLVITGRYQYISPDGTPIEVTYIADENGYQPTSNILPQAPPVPEAILRAIKYNAEHPQFVEPLKKF